MQGARELLRLPVVEIRRGNFAGALGQVGRNVDRPDSPIQDSEAKSRLPGFGIENETDPVVFGSELTKDGSTWLVARADR